MSCLHALYQAELQPQGPPPDPGAESMQPVQDEDPLNLSLRGLELQTQGIAIELRKRGRKKKAG